MQELIAPGGGVHQRALHAGDQKPGVPPAEHRADVLVAEQRRFERRERGAHLPGGDVMDYAREKRAAAVYWGITRVGQVAVAIS